MHAAALEHRLREEIKVLTTKVAESKAAAEAKSIETRQEALSNTKKLSDTQDRLQNTLGELAQAQRDTKAVRQKLMDTEHALADANRSAETLRARAALPQKTGLRRGDFLGVWERQRDGGVISLIQLKQVDNLSPSAKVISLGAKQIDATDYVLSNDILELYSSQNGQPGDRERGRVRWLGDDEFEFHRLTELGPQVAPDRFRRVHP